MNLTRDSLVYYLLETGLITLESVVDGDYQVADMSRRNRNFMVIRKKGQGYFIKQGDNSLSYEAGLYQVARSSEDLSSLASMTPDIHHYDTTRNILVLELLSDGVDLWTYQVQRDEFPLDIAEMLGKALACLHTDVSRVILADKTRLRIGTTMPWIFSFCKNPSYPAEYLSDANIEMLEVVRSYPEFLEALVRLMPQWNADSLIHNDIKFENCILRAVSEHESTVKLVDWELAIVGDPLWDVGAVFQAYLALAIRRMQASSEQTKSDSSDNVFTGMQAAVRRFWNTYTVEAGLDRDSVKQALEQAVQYAGIRLIQTAFEQTQGQSHLSPDAVYQLQASSNLLKKPQEGITQLMGA